MSDAAAFFAKKKKKKGKKAFSFNANKVDVSAVTSNIHVDAPAVSSEAEVPSSLNQMSIAKNNDNTGDWDESAQVAKATTAATGAGPSELMDMKALELKRNEQDDIAERLRVEETKAQLAAAKAGMEKEAQRLKEEKEFKTVKKAANTAPRPSGLGGLGGGAGGNGKWVPVHMRNSAASRPAMGGSSMGGSSRFGNVSGVSTTGYQRKVDTNDDMLFPDLGAVAAADKAAEEVEEQKRKEALRVSAAARKQRNAAKKAAEAEKEAEEETPVEPTPAPAPVPAPAPAPAPTPAAAPAPIKKKSKKKKKDLSTFKPT